MYRLCRFSLLLLILTIGQSGNANLLGEWFRGWSDVPAIVFNCQGKTVYYRQAIYWLTLSGDAVSSFDYAFGKGAAGLTCSEAEYLKGPLQCADDMSVNNKEAMKCLKNLGKTVPDDYQELKTPGQQSGSTP